MSPKVVILVLNWNRKEITCACLDSLKNLEYDNYEVLVIDNGSKDGSEEEIRVRYPWAGLLQNGENLGFAEGNNRGIKWALQNGADYIFLINNDTVIDEHCVSRLVDAAEWNSSFGILGPIAYEYGSWAEPLSSGLHLHWGSNWVWPFKWGNVNEMLASEEELFPFDLIQGDAFFVRRSVFEKIGFFDPRFFLFFEEYDLCLRAKGNGFGVGIVKSARYQRMKSATIGTYPYRSVYYTTRNFLFFLFKNFGFSKKRSVLAHYLKRVKWDFEDRILKNALKGHERGELLNFFSRTFPMAHGCFDFLTGRFGKLKQGDV